jgi:hypothetical protein
MGLRPSPGYDTQSLRSGGHAGDPDRSGLGVKCSGDLDCLAFELFRFVLIIKGIRCLAGRVPQDELSAHLYDSAGETLHVGSLVHRLRRTRWVRLLLLGCGGIPFLLGIQARLDHG